MSVKIEWKIFTAETQSDGTWKSNSPSLEELLNAIASPLRIKEYTSDIEYSMAQLAVKGLPYFRITEVASGHAGIPGNETEQIQA
ncbi:hypothetical protein MSHOH_0883 [Methanosarcina horonobensis HB-1 = JCM 15518]|uniref:Uncharacterized protein n=1 Tax=Methanosarcina horonobensis HB-1 = JCM 15518 TaxID=1434110 RepID=A0A0E3S9I5_9EURY|nr:hypothetical protein [Methanosarcina horonobensis]AKB77366.1 hypothetical protein MSHOH_0883 [Methanosarcina horonobensis HB-1 = JCM 15518]